MALMLGALRAALVDAGASEASADRAAEEVAGYENRLAGIETRLAVVQWMVGLTLAGVAGLGWLLLRVAAKVGVF